MSVNAAVVAVDAEGVMIEHGAEDARGVHAVAFAGGELDRGSVREIEARARSLPEGNFLGSLELGVLVVEGVGLEEHVGGGTELGQHHDVLEIARAEPLHAADVEQGRHSRHPADGESHLIRGVADELGIDDSLSRGERLAVLLVEAVQKVHTAGVTGAGVGARVAHVVEGLAHHIVDGTHDEVVKCNRHPLLDLIEKHREEAIELGRAGEGLVQGLLLNRPLDLERGHLVEELDEHVRLVEHVRIVGSAVRQVPAFVLRSDGEPGADLLQNGAVSPIVHQDGGSRAGVGPVHEHDLADVVDEGSDESVKRVGVEDCGAGINEALKIFGDEVITAEGFGERTIDDLINLSYFHVFFLLSI